MTHVRSCPRCRRSSLVPTGAYWGCSSCGYAITHAALCFEYQGQPMRQETHESTTPVEAEVGARS